MREVYLVGYPVSHSVSPAMQNAAFASLGIPLRYSLAPVEPAALREYADTLRGGGIRGCNVTIPHKVAIAPLLDELDVSARSIGAVNTVVNDGGRLTGYNTDAAGAYKALSEAFGSLRGLRMLILGAGGGARAVAYALREEAESVTVVSRDAVKAARLADEVGAEAGDWSRLAAHIGDADLLVNATPLGMGKPEETPVPARLIHAGLTVFDLVYTPLETRLLREARLAGCRALGGAEMLVYQGAEAFRLWTGREPPVAVMREAAVKALEART